MRATLTATSVVVLLAASAGSAAARPDTSPNPVDAANHATSPAARPAVSPNRVDAANHAAGMLRLAARQRRADGDLTPVTSAGTPAPAPIVHITREPLAEDGFSWADAGIGAGLATALLLGAAGASTRRRHHRVALR
jgi:hypothetical protein